MCRTIFTEKAICPCFPCKFKMVSFLLLLKKVVLGAHQGLTTLSILWSHSILWPNCTEVNGAYTLGSFIFKVLQYFRE